MGRRFLWRRQYSYIRVEESDPGCIYGLLRLLNYHHHWHNVKRIIPHKKHGANSTSTSRRARVDAGNPKPIGHHKAVKGQQEFKGEEQTELIPVTSVAPCGINSSSKRSIKAKIKGLMSDKNRTKLKSKPPGASVQFKLQSLHQEEHNGGQSKLDSSEARSRDNVDVLEVFKVNKQIFLKVLQEQEIAKAFQSLDNKYINQRRAASLTKSGSFPSACSSSLRFGSPSKLECKHKEVWPPQTKGLDNLNNETALGDNDLNKRKLQSMRRTSSLNESAGRYAQLFDFISKKEIKKNLSSRSLKLGAESDSCAAEPALRAAFRMRLSAPEIEYTSFVPVIYSPRAAAADRKSDLTVNTECKSFDISVNSREHVSSLASSTLEVDKKDDSPKVDWSGASENPDPAVATHLEDYQISNKDSTAPGTDPQSTSNLEEAEYLETQEDDHVLRMEVKESNEDDFLYVKSVLDQIGLATEDQLQALSWHSFDQPLSPSLFDDMEVNFSSFDKQKYSSCIESPENITSRKLLFDLVNMALVDIDEKLCLYYPKALSFSCHVHPLPKGQDWILKEVWEIVAQCLSWRVEVSSTLDLVVAKDLHVNDDWMNLQTQTECVGLELEDLILEGLLDDILLSCQ